jgi:hypothetical protein
MNDRLSGNALKNDGLSKVLCGMFVALLTAAIAFTGIRHLNFSWFSPEKATSPGWRWNGSPSLFGDQGGKQMPC